MATAKKNFDDLDDYSKLRIFHYLDIRSLLECAAVSKGFNNLIGQSSSLMQQISLHLTGQAVININPSGRKYKNLILTRVLIDELAMKKMRKILGSVQLFEMSDIATFSSYKICVEFFTCLVAAEKVKIYAIKIQNDQQPEYVVHAEVELNFKSIEFGWIPVDTDDSSSKWEMKIFEFLLSRQRSLKALSFNSYSLHAKPLADSIRHILIEILCDNYERLKTLESFSIVLRTYGYQTNIIEFLQRFRDLKKLHLAACSDSLKTISPYLMTTIQSHMKKLTDLSLSLDDGIGEVMEWMENRRNPPKFDSNSLSSAEQNLQLARLKLDKVMPTNSAALFEAFPNITHLRIELDEGAPHPLELAHNASRLLKSLQDMRLPAQWGSQGDAHNLSWQCRRAERRCIHVMRMGRRLRYIFH